MGCNHNPDPYSANDLRIYLSDPLSEVAVRNSPVLLLLQLFLYYSVETLKLCFNSVFLRVLKFVIFNNSSWKS